MEQLPEGHPKVEKGMKCPYQQKASLKNEKKCPMDQTPDDNILTTEDFLCGSCNSYLVETTVLYPCKHLLCSYCASEIEKCPKCEKEIKKLEKNLFHQHLVESFLETQWSETWKFQNGEKKLEEISQYARPLEEEKKQVSVDEKISKSLYYLHIAMISKKSMNPRSTIVWSDFCKIILNDCKQINTEQKEKISNLLGVILGLQADMYVLLKEPKKSEQLYKESIQNLNIFKSDLSSLCISISKLANLYWHHLKQFDKSEQQFFEAIKIFENEKSLTLELTLDFVGVLIHLSQLYLEKSEEEKSEKTFSKAKKEFSKIQDEKNEYVESYKNYYFQ